MKLRILIILLILNSALSVQAIDVENVRFEQRTDGDLLVDIYYDLSNTGGNTVDISVEASDDSGTTWILPCNSLIGDVGIGISEGNNKHILWNFYADNPDTSGFGYKVRVIAEYSTDIYSTAGEGWFSIDSAATAFAADAELIEAKSIDCDTTGKSLTWMFKLKSVDQQINHEFWCQSGKAVDKGSIEYHWYENAWTITNEWIDSDSAMVIAENNGGKEFRDEFEIENITMGLDRPFEESAIWKVCYMAQDTSFCTEFDASNEGPNLNGLIITEDYTLNEDIIRRRPDNVGYDCAITISAPDVTLDLGGHTVSGDLSNGYVEGVTILENCTGVTIKNGTIENFSIAVTGDSDGLTVENVTIRNLVNDEPDFYNGIVYGNSKNILIKDCHFEFLRVSHKEAIIMGACDFTVDNCDFKYGSVGVNFGGQGINNGTVINSRFNGVCISGLLIQTCASGVIYNNVFIENETAIATDPNVRGGVTGLDIEGNEIQDGVAGINFNGVTESNIINNTIKNNGANGIALAPGPGCPRDEVREDCYYSTDNIIRNNVVIGNFPDLHQYEGCIDNIWEGNVYIRKIGSEIPICTTGIFSTAGEGWLSIDSAATEFAADAELMKIESTTYDTVGKSLEWSYIFRSVTQESCHGFWYRNGEFADQGPIEYNWYKFAWPVSYAWFDSDSAMVIAEQNGGKEFRDEFEIQRVQMSLEQPNEETTLWKVWYVAQDTTFFTEFNAVSE